MRTVFVNPASKRHSKKRRKRTSRKGRRKSYHFKGARITGTVRRNAGITPFVANPMILSNPRRRRRHRRNPSGAMLNDLAYIFGGAVGGAALNRLAFNHVNHFYVRNGARIAAAAVLAYIGGRNPLTAAAAGATLAPLIPDVEMMLGSSAPKKNPRELAAELSAMLEADLSSDEVIDADLSDEGTEDDLDDDLIDDDLDGIDSMKW
jgi:hypothetical protein